MDHDEECPGKIDDYYETESKFVEKKAKLAENDNTSWDVAAESNISRAVVSEPNHTIASWKNGSGLDGKSQYGQTLFLQFSNGLSRFYRLEPKMCAQCLILIAFIIF
jgi:hypothetical protein